MRLSLVALRRIDSKCLHIVYVRKNVAVELLSFSFFIILFNVRYFSNQRIWFSSYTTITIAHIACYLLVFKRAPAETSKWRLDYFSCFYVFHLWCPENSIKTLVFLHKYAFLIDDLAQDQYVSRVQKSAVALMEKLT
jgi:hypothetical protein